MADQTKHSITLKIAGKEYRVIATPEQEHYYRLAADKVNATLKDYETRFPTQTLTDKLAFVALSETVARLTTKRNCDKELAKYDDLEKELHTYLDKIETDR